MWIPAFNPQLSILALSFNHAPVGLNQFYSQSRGNVTGWCPLHAHDVRGRQLSCHEGTGYSQSGSAQTRGGRAYVPV